MSTRCFGSNGAARQGPFRFDKGLPIPDLTRLLDANPAASLETLWRAEALDKASTSGSNLAHQTKFRQQAGNGCYRGSRQKEMVSAYPGG
jgi:hypothetical protein